MEVRFDYEKFQKMRKAKRLSQMKLAELAGTTDRYIRAMEAGVKTNPSAIILYRAGLVLGQPVEAFMMLVPEDMEDGNG